MSTATLTAIPNELRERSQWMAWTYQNKNKLPIDCHTGRSGKSNDLTTWCSYDQAEDYVKTHNAQGTAFVFSNYDPYTGIDLDSCRNAETGELSDWALQIVDSFKTYTEISPSGAGVKLICRASKPENARCRYAVKAVPSSPDKKPAIEVYDFGRFWCMTGDVLPGFEQIADGQLALERFTESQAAKSKKAIPSASHNGHASRLFRSASNYVAKVPNAGIGDRDNSTFSLAGNLAAFVDNGQRLTESEIVQLVTNWNVGNNPPLSEADISRAVNSAMNNGTPRPDKFVEAANTKTQKGKSRITTMAAGSWDLWHDSGKTDAANAQRFVNQFQNQLLFVPTWKRWLTWDGMRWHDNNGIGAQQRAKQYADDLWKWIAEAAKKGEDRDGLGVIQTFVKRTNGRGAIADFLDLAKSDERVVCQVEQLNTNPLLLNVRNGTIDLTTGKLREHDPADRITQFANVEFDPQATCPHWRRTIDLVFDGNRELPIYLQELLGYSTCGLSTEALLPICWGNGRNGKSTIWNVLAKLLHDYGMIASSELLMPTKNQTSYDKASLYGKRFVAVSEPAQGRYLDESAAKELTGNDTISARRPFEMPFNFSPTHKLWMATNHKPKIRGTDTAIWRRIKLIPFTVDLASKTEIVTGFSDWLVEHEGPGILNWLLAGFREWHSGGFDEPDAVKVATAHYRQSEDHIGQFIGDHCEIGDGLECRAVDLYAEYAKHGGKMSQTFFGDLIGQRFEKSRPHTGPNRRVTVYSGLSLRSGLNP